MVENNKEIREIRALIKDLIESQKITDEQLKKTDEEIKKLTESQKKTDEQLKKTDKQIKNLGKEIGKFTDGWGRFVEGIVAPSIPKLFFELGFVISETHHRAKSRKDGMEMEIDLLALGKQKNKEFVLVAEVKSTLKVGDVQEFIEELDHFFEFFEGYRGKELIGIVCGVSLVKGVEKYAEREGLFVLSPSGDSMKILNKKDFKPKIWRFSG
ncbi:MAG TPA: DUF3782 domain-containing protein [Methanosarcinales archaeon]|nr:DUF3782 domain-containing protein [Methanosarcinales archaeon]